MRPTSQKALSRLEASTLGGRAQQDLDFMPGFLSMACKHLAGACTAIQDTAEWAAFMAPFSTRATQAQLAAEMQKRVDALLPVLKEKGDAEVINTFFALLIWPEMADIRLPGKPAQGRDKRKQAFQGWNREQGNGK